VILFLGNHLRNVEMAERDIQVSVINTHTYNFVGLQVLHPNSMSLPGDRMCVSKGKALRNVSLSNLCISFQNKLTSPGYLDV